MQRRIARRRKMSPTRAATIRTITRPETILPIMRRRTAPATTQQVLALASQVAVVNLALQVRPTEPIRQVPGPALALGQPRCRVVESPLAARSPAAGRARSREAVHPLVNPKFP